MCQAEGPVSSVLAQDTRPMLRTCALAVLQTVQQVAVVQLQQHGLRVLQLQYLLQLPARPRLHTMSA